MKLQLDLLCFYLLCFYLLCFTGKTLCDEKGPAAIKVLVSEGSDVTLPCSLSTKENIQQNLFDWTKDDGVTGVFMYDNGLHHNNGGSGQDEQFKGRVFHFQDELKHGNASIIIRNTKVADSGDYTCFFPLLQRREKSHVTLVVVSSPKPSVTVLNATVDWMLLQCEVHGASPKPKAEWRDSAGNKLPAEEPQVTDRGGTYDIILQTTVTETDHYRCVVTQEEINHQTYTEISVHIIGPAAIKVLVSEGSDVTLPCSLSTKENIQQNLFDWRKDDGVTGVFMYDKGLHHNNGRSGQAEQFKGRVFHFQDELKHGNASIIIRNTKVADSGNYTCVFPLVQRREKSHVTLVVVSSPKPSVTVLDATNDWMHLQCEVHGASPKPKAEWKDSAGNKLPAVETQVTDRGGSYDIILQTSVKKTVRYQCVVTQEEINHQIHAEIDVDVCGKTWSINIVLSILLAVAILVILGLVAVVLFRYHHRPNDWIVRGSKGSKTAEREEEQQLLNTGAHDSQAAAPRFNKISRTL